MPMTLDEFLKLPGAKVHDGGPCPVDGDTEVDVFFIDGEDSTGDELPADHYDWDWHDIPGYNIIAYREVQP